MEISLTKELINKLKNECDICRTYKLVEYLVTDVKGNMFSICKKCRNDLLREKNETKDGS